MPCFRVAANEMQFRPGPSELHVAEHASPPPLSFFGIELAAPAAPQALHFQAARSASLVAVEARLTSLSRQQQTRHCELSIRLSDRWPMTFQKSIFYEICTKSTKNVKQRKRFPKKLPQSRRLRHA